LKFGIDDLSALPNMALDMGKNEINERLMGWSKNYKKPLQQGEPGFLNARLF